MPDRRIVDGSEGSGAPINPRMTFGTYLVGRGNLIAHTAARHVADERASSSAMFNPLLVLGAHGLGKTHLLQALAHALQSGSRRTLYISGRDFPKLTPRLATAVDVLIVDDIDCINTNQKRTAFVTLMAEMTDGGHQVVMSSLDGPAELEFNHETRRRITGGLIVKLDGLDHDLRLGILRHKAVEMATSKDMNAPDDAILRTLALRLAGNGRDLDTALQAMFALALVMGGEFPHDHGVFVEKILDEIGQKEIVIDTILSTVARYFGVTRADILSKNRQSSIVMPRHVAMYLTKEMTNKSLPEIGRRFGWRDHTTVLHGVRKISDQIGKSDYLAEQIDELKRILQEHE